MSSLGGKALKIISLQVYTLRFLYKPENRFRYANGECTGRLTSIVRVRTDDGIEGIGSAYSHPVLIRSIIEDHLGPFLIGKNAIDIQESWTQNQRLTQWYGRKGAALSAIGAIDIALWDIVGKTKGVAVSNLLGAVTDRVPVYASGLLWRDRPTGLREEAQRHIDRGFQAVKMRVGKSFAYDVEAIRQVRDVIGPNRRLIVDGNARFSLKSAKEIVPILEDSDIFWFEEPFPPDDLAPFAELKRNTKVQLAAGENEFGLRGFKSLVANEAVDILQPDCSRAGGISECTRIAKLASENGLKIAPHTWSDAIALVANLHFVASCKNGLMVEMDQTGNPFIEDLLTERLTLDGGFLRVPNGPGLGIEIDDDVLHRYAIDPHASIPEGNYSDMVFGTKHYSDAPPYQLSGGDCD